MSFIARQTAPLAAEVVGGGGGDEGKLRIFKKAPAG